MKATKFFAAAAVFAIAGSAFAADTTPAAAAAATAAATTAMTSITATSLNVPAVTITKNVARSRSDVHAEAVEFVKNHKTALAIMLEQSKN